MFQVAHVGIAVTAALGLGVVTAASTGLYGQSKTGHRPEVLLSLVLITGE